MEPVKKHRLFMLVSKTDVHVKTTSRIFYSHLRIYTHSEYKLIMPSPPNHLHSNKNEDKNICSTPNSQHIQNSSHLLSIHRKTCTHTLKPSKTLKIRMTFVKVSRRNRFSDYRRISAKHFPLRLTANSENQLNRRNKYF